MPNRFVLPVGVLLWACGSPSVPDRAVEPNAEAQVVADSGQARSLLAELSPEIEQEIRYSTTQNFTGEILPGYGRGLALMRREAAQALGRVQERLAAQGLGLKVWDAYRPFRATQEMVAWATREGRTALLDDGYIARRSRHNQGVAVDLTVVNRSTGNELDMGTPFDTFSEAAHTANAIGTVATNRSLLNDVMVAEGFVNYQNEWWHFSYEVVDPVPFDMPLEAW